MRKPTPAQLALLRAVNAEPQAVCYAPRRAYEALMRKGLVKMAMRDGRDGVRMYWVTTEKGRKALEGR